eukprot:664892-Amphidinium_carterae.1
MLDLVVDVGVVLVLVVMVVFVLVVVVVLVVSDVESGAAYGTWDCAKGNAMLHDVHCGLLAMLDGLYLRNCKLHLRSRLAA